MQGEKKKFVLIKVHSSQMTCLEVLVKMEVDAVIKKKKPKEKKVGKSCSRK